MNRSLLMGLLLVLTPVSVSAQEAQGPVAGPQQVEAAGTTPGKSADRVSVINVRGLRRVGREAAMVGVKTKVGMQLDIELLTEDLRSLWDTGFFKDVRVYRKKTGAGWVVTFEIAEKPSIREVRYEGFDDVTEEDIKGVVDVRPFTILNVEHLKRNVQKVHDLYVEKGHYLAQIEYRTQPVEKSPHEVDIIFMITENAKVIVREILIIGNKRVKEDEIKPSLQTREGGELSWMSEGGTYKEEFFQSDLFRISAVYWDKGFAAIKVGEPTATISPDRRFIYLSVPVEEGPRFNFGKVTFSGDIELKNAEGEVIVDEAMLAKKLKIKKGATFSRTELLQDLQALTDIYRDQGYAYANVTPNSNADSKKRVVDLDLVVERGDIVYIERINIVGNSKTRDKVIRREMRIVEGDRYSARGINRSRARIFQLGFFETVNVNSSRGSKPDKMKLTVEIKERSTGTLQIGAGFSSVESFIATAQISQNNFLGNGQSLSVSTQLSFGEFSRQLATVQFFEPYFLDTRWSFGLNGFITQRGFRDFQRSSNGFSPSFGYLLTPDLRINTGYTLEQIKITTGGGGVDSGPALSNLNRDGRQSSLNTSLSYDTRDNRLFPSRGMYHIFRFEISDKFLGSQAGLQFKRTQLIARYYRPLFWSLVLKLNASFGWVFGGGELGVPISERFAPGGIFSVRGFEIRGLGPTVRAAQTGCPNCDTRLVTIGGDEEAVFNVEFEFPIVEAAGIKGVFFADAGNAYNENENFFYINTPKDRIPDAFLTRSGKRIKPPLGLYYSFGFGFRWFSPIGPLRFEWGIPITKRNRDDRGLIFEFTIGNFF